MGSCMGYACPVCAAEQADAVHLANHLAVTASLGRRDHEDWLTAHAPDWAEYSPAELAELVVEYAEEIDTPDFEDGHGHEHGRPGGLEGELARQTRHPGRGTLTAEAADVLEEARELTRRMHDADEADDDDADTTGDENENA
ncbi:hypothetical protein AArc1_0170 [Natrarchaeobaculum sulfurireducens]|uniref:Uncharacterized protein n=2 Tax=Natrarchaeobaculum sulfurireducens TaxID=2044521 RepID=A0A346PAG9_9EURY|nr:hypothetical protein AArc1_0170 [Natrarchaeobaculum sulfurireducens]